MPTTLDLAASSSDAHTRHTLRNISLAVAKSKRIVVVTGAGISCSCGIPDFRSSDGLYNIVKQKYPDVVLKGRDLFDASLFRDTTSTSVFYTFISGLKRSIDIATPSPTHRFIQTLDAKKRLLRSYTQNIDGLEERVGLAGSSSEGVKGKGKTKIRTKDVRNVQLHGDIHRVRCTFCSADYPCTEDYLAVFETGEAPECPECTSRSAARLARSARALKIGNLRPSIVLYDEPHPLGDEIGSIQTVDVNKKPDMLVIMGTSLKVHGLKKLVKDFARAVHASSTPSTTTPADTKAAVRSTRATKPTKPRPVAKASPKNAKNLVDSLAGRVIFVNRTPPGPEWDGIIDYWVQGESDAWVTRVEEEWRSMRPGDWEVQKTLDGKDAAATTKAGAKAAGASKPPKSTFGKPAKGVFTINDAAVEVENLPVGPVPSTPTSPSKRRKEREHYSSSSDVDTDVECSPSKRRGRALGKRGSEQLTPATAAARRFKKLGLDGDQSMHMPERGLLFGRERTNDKPSVVDGTDNESDLTECSDDEEDILLSPPRPARKAAKANQGKMKATPQDAGAQEKGTNRPFGRTASRMKVEVVLEQRVAAEH